MTQIQPCPLCQNSNSTPYFQDKKRSYLQCQNCQLVFVPKTEILSPNQELNEYLLHENSPLDEGYRQFLSRITTPLSRVLKQKACGLDFGCGPGPTLHLLMQEQGFSMKLYDPFFHKDTDVLSKKYDFITATEVIEHIHHPSEVIPQLWRMLHTDGVLALMTKLVIDQQSFSRWHYKNDPTHICFYSKDTFKWLASQLNAELELIDKDVIFLRKAQ